jgi:hypothetical protein
MGASLKPKKRHGWNGRRGIGSKSCYALFEDNLALKAWAFMDWYIERRGYAPSRGEVSAEVGAAVSTMQRVYDRLAKYGVIEFTPGVMRGVHLVVRWESPEGRALVEGSRKRGLGLQ